VGEGGAAHAYELQRRDCDGAQFGPFEITFQALWSSSNSQVVTINGSDFTCVGVGVADVNVSYIGTDFLGSELNEICEESEVSFFASCPVTVFRLRIRTAGSLINFDNSDYQWNDRCGENLAKAVNSQRKSFMQAAEATVANV
jgi:hypothetical protein